MSALETCLLFIQADCWLQDAKTCRPPLCFTVQYIPPSPPLRQTSWAMLKNARDQEPYQVYQITKPSVSEIVRCPTRKLNSFTLPAFPRAGYCTWTTFRSEKGPTSLRTATSLPASLPNKREEGPPYPRLSLLIWHVVERWTLNERDLVLCRRFCFYFDDFLDIQTQGNRYK